MKIEKVSARQVFDSRGNPTVEAEVITSKAIGRAVVPSGASTGIHEAHELRDGGSKYGGKGVLKAVNNINTKINKRLKGLRIEDHRIIDEALIELDGTREKKNLGANAILAVSMASARAGAFRYNMYLHEYLGELYSNRKFVLPIPFANLINGGVHAGNDLDFQEFMVAPIKAKSFTQASMMVSEIYHELKEILNKSYGKSATNVGDEGGFAPPIKNPEEGLDLLEVATEEVGYSKKVGIAMDVAASEFYNKNRFYLLGGKKYSEEELADYYVSLKKSYKNIISIEDPFDQDSFSGFKTLTKRLGNSVQIVGDDLTVSNVGRIMHAVEQKLCNTLLLKVNQIGTITESMQAAHYAHKNGWKVMVSHRSGESEDPFIADLAVGIGCGQIKLGAPCRGERTAKYNQLLRIEEWLGKKAKYANFK